MTKSKKMDKARDKQQVGPDQFVEVAITFSGLVATATEDWHEAAKAAADRQKLASTDKGK